MPGALVLAAAAPRARRALGIQPRCFARRARRPAGIQPRHGRAGREPSGWMPRAKRAAAITDP
jgi:hypothetical protein